MLLQFLYGETESAAQEIVDAVVPAADEVTKEEIAEVAAEKAEAIADAVDEAVEGETGEPLSEEAYAELVVITAQTIYTNTMAELATTQACYALESLFSDEDVEEYYAGLEDVEQDEYSVMDKIKSSYGTAKGHVGRNATKYGTGAGAAVGAGAGALIARKRGSSVKKGAIVGALVGAGAGATLTEAGKFGATARSLKKSGYVDSKKDAVKLAASMRKHAFLSPFKKKK